MLITEEFLIRWGDRRIGTCYIYENGSSEFIAFQSSEPLPEEAKALGLEKNRRSRTLLPRFKAVMDRGERAPGTRKVIWREGALSMERVPKDIDKFWVYRRSAGRGEPTYSPRSHAVPHREGSRVVEGMEEWAGWYAFNKKEDGMFEAELDEAWDEGSRYGGGTIRAEVPEEWLEKPWEEFLERLVTLAAAAHYGFTPEELGEKPGLKAFFGFE